MTICLWNASCLSRYENEKVNYLLVVLKDVMSLPTSTLLFSYQYTWLSCTVFDESCAYYPEVDNSPSEEAFAAIIEEVTEYPPDLTHLEPVSLLPTHDPIIAAPSVIEQYDPSDYQEHAEYDIDSNPEPFPLILADSEEYELKINKYGIPIHWNKITGDASPTPVHSMSKLNCMSCFRQYVHNVCLDRMPYYIQESFRYPGMAPSDIQRNGQFY